MYDGPSLKLLMGLLVEVVMTLYGEWNLLMMIVTELREVNSPRVGRAVDDVLNDIDRLWRVMVGVVGVDTEEEAVCVGLVLVVMLVLLDEDEE